MRCQKWLSQEWLKVIACVTMLLDHIGAAFVPGISGNILRGIGRIAFPVYCFLLAEGVHYTRSPRKYALRLLTGLLLSEIPFDLLFFGRLSWAYSSVMVTLLLGFFYGVAVKRIQNPGVRILLVVPFVAAAELLGSDYGGWGVALIAMFILTREIPRKNVVQTVGLAAICCLIGGATISIGGLLMPVELLGVVAMIPILCYSGEKATSSRWIQRGFYLFYPVHLTVLLLIAVVKYGYLI